MIHHDGRDYDVAKSEAGRKGRQIMEKMIEDGRVRAQHVIEEVTNKVIQDSIVRTKAVEITPDGGSDRWLLGIKSGGNMTNLVPLHNHALQQLLSDAGLPKLYADKMEKEANGDEWGKGLVKYNIDTIFKHRETQRNLVRAEGGLVKGWLSDKFRRLDSRPLLEAFAGACMANNLMPIEGYALDTKVRLRAIVPHVFEPIPNEPMVVGLTWGNSDYGNGGHVVDVFINRVWCTNLATMESALRQIHLGKRLNDDITFSAETYRKDTEANISALQDVVAHVIGPAKVNALMQVIASMAEKSVGKDVVALLKDYPAIGKDTVEKIAAAYDSPDVVNLPPGENMWRLSNAVSWIAQSKDIDVEKKLELQDIAGKMLKHKSVVDSLAV